MVDPSNHSQDMNNVLKHLVYVYGGCGNYSMWVQGLNCWTSTQEGYYLGAHYSILCHTLNYRMHGWG